MQGRHIRGCKSRPVTSQEISGAEYIGGQRSKEGIRTKSLDNLKTN